MRWKNVAPPAPVFPAKVIALQIPGCPEMNERNTMAIWMLSPDLIMVVRRNGSLESVHPAGCKVTHRHGSRA